MKTKLRPKIAGKVFTLPVGEIAPNPAQPRREFAAEELEALAASIRENGLLQPISVRVGKGGYVLIAGERRLRAAKLAGLKSLPAIIVDAKEEQAAVLALVENLHRADLNIFEQAQALRTLLDIWGVTQEEVAKKLRLSQSAIANKLRLLKLSDACRETVLRYRLSERHARAVLSLPEEKQLSLLRQAGEHSWTVGKLEEVVRRVPPAKGKRPSKIAVIKDLRLFFNSFQKTVRAMEQAGIYATSEQVEGESCIQFIVTIPK